MPNAFASLKCSKNGSIMFKSLMPTRIENVKIKKQRPQIGQVGLIKIALNFDFLKTAHRSSQNVGRADCRPCRLSTFFLTSDSCSFSVLQLQNSACSICPNVCGLSTGHTMLIQQTNARLCTGTPFSGQNYTKIKHKSKLPYIQGANCVKLFYFFCPVCCCCCCVIIFFDFSFPLK